MWSDPTTKDHTMTQTHAPHWLTSSALALVMLGCTSDATEPEGYSDEFTSEMTTAIQAATEDWNLPGLAVHVFHPDRGAWSHAEGVASIEESQALTTAHRARAGSVLKTFVAVAVLQQVERGTLNLDDKLSVILDDDVTRMIPNADGIDVRMLLQHRSGIPDWVNDKAIQQIVADPARVWSLEDRLSMIEDLPAVFSPDAEFGYSNTNYSLLGEILEVVSDRRWRSIVQQDVFSLAGVDEGLLPAPGDATCDTCARGYQDVGAPELVDMTEIDPSMAGAAGGHALVAAADELSTLLRAINDGVVFDSDDTLALMMDMRPASGIGIETYGMGMLSWTFGQTEAVGHTGGTAGFQSFMFHLPQEGFYVSGFTNIDAGADFIEVGDALVDALVTAP